MKNAYEILELLLVLTGFDLKKNNSEHVYFSDVQIDAIKKVTMQTQANLLISA